ncbi:unnamed protein product [Urochloa humidicola]
MLPLILLAAGTASMVATSGDNCPLALVAYYFSTESNLSLVASGCSSLTRFGCGRCSVAHLGSRAVRVLVTGIDGPS